jgi:hypothetical protein
MAKFRICVEIKKFITAPFNSRISSDYFKRSLSCCFCFSSLSEISTGPI